MPGCGLDLETVEVRDLLVGRRTLTFGGSGGLCAAQEPLDFRAAQEVAAKVEVLPSAEAGTALARREANDVRYRFVLDLGDLDGRTG